MSQKRSLKQKYENYMFNHLKLKNVLDTTFALIAIIISAFIFAFGFRSFINPFEGISLASGGMSGCSQIILKIIELCGVQLSPQLFDNLLSIAYFVLNIPVFILAWTGIGKRFALYSLVNIFFVSFFISIIPESLVTHFTIASDDFISRALFAGICTGLSSSLAYYVDGSAGGLDIISYYIALKKSTSVGKYMFGFNVLVITVFTILSSIQNSDASIILLYTAVYLFTASTVTDKFSIRNKKSQIQIITQNENLSTVLITQFPHGCTVADAKGAFSGKNVKILYMVVSSFEVKKVVDVIHAVDPNAFVNISSISQVYGKFYIKPIK